MKFYIYALILVFLLALTSLKPDFVLDRAWPDCYNGQGNIFNATTVVLVDSTAQQTLENGWIIAFVDEDGDCIGMALYQGQGNFAIPIWGDDLITPKKDGALPGASFSIEMFGKKRLDYTSDKPFIFVEDEVYVLSALSFPGSNLDQQATIDSLNSVISDSRDSLQVSEQEVAFLKLTISQIRSLTEGIN